MSLARFLVLTPKGIPQTPMRPADRHGDFSAFAGYLYGLSEGAILPPAPASAAALLPSAILCIRFLVIPYGGWAPYLTSPLVLPPCAHRRRIRALRPLQ